MKNKIFIIPGIIFFLIILSFFYLLTIDRNPTEIPSNLLNKKVPEFKTSNLIKDKNFVVYTDGVTEGYLKNGQELGADGVERIVKDLSSITPKNIVDSIATELNWGAEKLRDDITCMAINFDNPNVIQKKKNKPIIKKENVNH